MSKKVFIDDAGSLALSHWRMFNPGLTVAAPAYFKSIDVVFGSDLHKDFLYYAHVEFEEESIDVLLEDKGRKLCKVVITRDKAADGYRKHVELFTPVRKENKNVLNAAINGFVTDILTVNAFFYNEIISERFLPSSGKRDEDVIVFRELDGDVYATGISCYEASGGIFVKGNIKRDLHGNVVWANGLN